MPVDTVGVVSQEATLKPIKETRLPRPPSIKSGKGFVKSRMRPGLIYKRDPCNDRKGFYMFIKPALLKIQVCDSVPEALN